MNKRSQKPATRTAAVEKRKIRPWPHRNDFYSLAKVAGAAAVSMPPRYLQSIFGPLASWLPPHGRFSEYNILNPWRFATMLRYLSDLSLPASAQSEPDWARAALPPFLIRRFWRPTSFFREPDTYGGVCAFPSEHWFFINGVATNGDVAKLNAAYVAHLFHRPVTVIQNPTNSLAVDLYECAIGKGFKREPDNENRKTMTEPVWLSTAAILEALNAPGIERVVVIAHSQGTIIAANVLRAIAKTLQSDQFKEKTKAKWHPFIESLMGEGLEPGARKILRDKLAHSVSVFAEDGLQDAEKKLDKLELYTFANCADKMRYVYGQVPYMEHFANERDLVARLGVLSPFRDGEEQTPVEIDGPVFEQKKAWGHLLNEHYLRHIDEHLYPSPNEDRPENPYPGSDPVEPRLYQYFHGKRAQRPIAVSNSGGLHVAPEAA